MSVEATVAEWLRSPALFARAGDLGIGADWGERAIETRIVSPYADYADAEDEGALQIQFLGPPKAVEYLEIDGEGHQLIGTWQTFAATGGGYDAGAAAFVIGSQPADGGRSRLSVIRRQA